MKRLALMPILFTLMLIASCDNKPKIQMPDGSDSLPEPQSDTAYYGVGGSGTSMHSLMLIGDAGDTLIFAVVSPGETYSADEPAPIGEPIEATAIKGGMPNVGDRVSVVAVSEGCEPTARQIVNLTSLQGKWRSIERSFEICEGGVVRQSNHTERASWAEWKMCNGQLILGTDTFAVNALTPDSLLIENRDGIYAYTRK